MLRRVRTLKRARCVMLYKSTMRQATASATMTRLHGANKLVLDRLPDAANILACANFLARQPKRPMMKKEPHIDLSRRERQIMDVVYRRGSATAAEITADLPEPPTSTAVRTMLRILENKGHLTHAPDGVRHVYRAVVDRDKARESVITHVIRTFFNGSAEQAMATLIDRSGSQLTDAELERLAALIARTRKRQERDK